jgi:hypothetical protein
MDMRKSDIGMYIVFTLVGAGIGYAIGRYVSERTKVVESPVVDPPVIFVKKRSEATLPKGKIKPYIEKTAEQVMLMAALKEKYAVSELQEKMFFSGLITFGQLEAELIESQFKKKKREYTAYEKPDLETLVELDDDLIEPIIVPEWTDDSCEYIGEDIDPYRLFLHEPRNGVKRKKRLLYYDIATGAFYETVRGTTKKVEESLLSDKNEYILEVISSQLGDVSTLYLLDEHSDILYEIREDPDSKDDILDEPEPVVKKKKKKD